jgi:hypothetical protein
MERADVRFPKQFSYELAFPGHLPSARAIGHLIPRFKD